MDSSHTGYALILSLGSETTDSGELIPLLGFGAKYPVAVPTDERQQEQESKTRNFDDFDDYNGRLASLEANR